MRGSEPRNGGMLRRILSTNHSDRHIHPTQPSNLTRRTHPPPTTDQSAAPTAPPGHSHTPTTSPTSPDQTRPDPHHPTPTAHETPKCPTARPSRAQTTPDESPATTAAYPAATKTADHDPPADTPTPRIKFSRRRLSPPTHDTAHSATASARQVQRQRPTQRGFHFT